MPVIPKCKVILRDLSEDARDVWNRWLEFPGDFAKQLRFIFNRADDYMRSLGPAGEELAEQVTNAARPAFRQASNDLKDVREALKGLSKAERELAMRYMNERVDTAPAKIIEAAEAVREILDRSMTHAQRVGFTRLTKDGIRIPLRGTGRAFPQRLNKRGQRFFRDLEKRGRNSPEAQAVAQRMVDEGNADDLEDAFDQLFAFRDDQLAGVNGYFERTRVELPDYMLEWDPARVLPFAIERNWLSVEGARQWGVAHPTLEVMLGRVERESGRFEARAVGDHIRTAFGVSGLESQSGRRFWGTLNNYQTASKLSGVFSPLLNFGQRFVNTADRPIVAHWNSFKDEPPIVGRWFESGQALRDSVERSGALRGQNVLADLQGAGFGQDVTELSIKPFMAVARGNEYRSAVLARYGAEADLRRFLELSEPRSPLRKMFDIATSLSVDPRGAVWRRLQRSGLSDQELLDKLRTGARFTEEEFATIMQKAVEDEQFALNMLTKTIWFDQHPFFRLMFKFKTFGVRQTEFIWDRVLGEARQGNMMPAAKFMAAAILMGELYHFTRDQLEGRERSVTMTLLNTPPDQRDPQQLLDRVWGNLVAQGGTGLLADLAYGITGFIGGPMGSTFQNVLEAAEHVVLDPRQTGTAIRELMRDEIVLDKQVERLVQGAGERLSNGGTSPFQDYWRFRNGAFQFERGQEAPNVAERRRQDLQRAVRGLPSFQATPRSLRYQYAARAITNGSVEDAAKYMAELFEGKSGSEQRSIETGLRSSMRRNAPLGPLNEEQRREYLATLKRDDRRRAVQLQRSWTRDYRRAITLAKRQARERR